MKYTKEQKREYFKSQLEDLKMGIEDKIKDFLEDSEELKEFIAFRRKHFYSYSINNSILIYKQCPTATFVAGFRKWADLGCKVRKGEKGLSILIPLIKKVRDDSGEDKNRIYGFRKGTVFDASQIEATEEAVPFPNIDVSLQATEETFYDPEVFLEGTKRFIQQHCPVDIVKDKSLGNAMGMTDGEKIYVKAQDDTVDMSGVLVHEFVHFYNHFKDNRKDLSKDERETEAELGAILYGSYFNFKIDGGYKYLAMYRDQRELEKCFDTALQTFEYILDGYGDISGLENILDSISGK